MATVHDLPEIHERLGEAFGVPVRQRGLDPLGELIQAILSQRTSGANSRCAYQQLRERFPTWEAVRDAETDAVAGAIRVAGLARLKAPRIKAVLAQIAEAHGSLDLDFLSAMPAERAMAWLQRLPGVGPTTAACVLLFGAGLPVMPVDGGIHRTVRRLGLAPARATAEHVRALLQHAVPPQWVYPLHVN